MIMSKKFSSKTLRDFSPGTFEKDVNKLPADSISVENVCSTSDIFALPSQVSMVERMLSGALDSYTIIKTNELESIPLFLLKTNNLLHSPTRSYHRNLVTRNSFPPAQLLVSLLPSTKYTSGTVFRQWHDIRSAEDKKENIWKSVLETSVLSNVQFVTSLTKEEAYIQSIKQTAIEAAGKIPDTAIVAFQQYAGRGTYTELHALLSHGLNAYTRTLPSLQFKAGTFTIPYGALIDQTRGKVLVMLTLKPEYLEYYLLNSYFLGGNLRPEIFTLKIDKDFATNNTPEYAKELWLTVNKGFIKVLPAEIPVEHVDGKEFFSHIFEQHAQAPLGPIEQIEHNATLQSEATMHLHSVNTLTSAGVTITL